MLMSFTILMIGTIAVSVIESAGFLDILFETTSAIGTVGLSTGLTPALHTASKICDYDLNVCRADRTGYNGAGIRIKGKIR